MEETISVLTDADALADISEGDEAHARGQVLRRAGAVRALRS